jgi:hypothetical protein
MSSPEQLVIILCSDGSVIGMTKLRVDWSRKNTTDVDPTIRRFERWLNEHGYREACVQTYVGAVRKFSGSMPARIALILLQISDYAQNQKLLSTAVSH